MGGIVAHALWARWGQAVKGPLAREYDGGMPDWTYQPLRRPMGALLGVRRSRLAALGLVAALTRIPGGRWVVAGLGHTAPPAEAAGRVAGVDLVARVGASVGPGVARDALRALPALGAGLVEVGSGRILVGETELPPDVVVLRNATVSQVRADGRPVIATTSVASPAFAADLIKAGAAAVLITSEGLIEAGPGWFHRATMAYVGKMPVARGRAWFAGLLLGLGMIAGGAGAAIVALGPVLLPYDASFLGVDSAGLAAINPRLIHFLQHDRITLAGVMVAIGILYSALSWWGIRRGLAWARDAMLASGVVGFPTLFYFFGYRYVEPAHVALAAVLFPLFVIATWRRPHGHTPVLHDEGPDAERQQALLGQLLMVVVGAGLIIGGLAISYEGLTAVFVPSDLSYMSTSAQALAAANDRLLSFIAHDRAGFGGALVSAGVAVLLIAAWGWERGQAWVWWTLLSSAAVGFGAALAVHVGVAYTDFLHVAPIYAGIAFTAISLALARRFLTAGAAEVSQSRVAGLATGR